MPIMVHEMGPDGQLIQVALEDGPSSASPAAPASAQGDGASAPPRSPETPAAPASAQGDGASAPPAPDDTAAPAAEQADTASAPETTTETAMDDEDEPPILSKSAQRRIDRLTRQREDARREAAALHERVRMIEEQGYTRPPAEPDGQLPVQGQARPRPEDFATHEEWVQASIDYNVTQRMQEWELRQLAQRQALEQQERESRWASKETAFRQQHSDYDARLDELNRSPLSPQLRRGLLESELAPELGYYLAARPDEVRQLNQLQPMALSRALGRLEAQLDTSQTAPPRPRSPSLQPKPAPPQPLNGATGVPRQLTDMSEEEIDAMSQREFDALYKRQFPGSR